MNPWFRLYHAVVDDPKVQRVSADTFRLWINVLCIACRNGGRLPSVADIAFTLRASEDQVKAWIAELISLELIDETEDGLTPHNWDERQFKSDSSTGRVKKHREKRSMKRFSETVSETLDETDQNRTEQNRAEQNNAAFAADSARAAVEEHRATPPRSARGKRTTEQIKKALGPERLTWWENFWGVYPCHEGMNPAMDAFERRVQDVDLARAVYRGAQRYRDRIAVAMAADPSTKVKYAQGWLSEERWQDEPAATPVLIKPTKYFDDSYLTRVEEA